MFFRWEPRQENLRPVHPFSQKDRNYAQPLAGKAASALGYVAYWLYSILARTKIGTELRLDMSKNSLSFTAAVILQALDHGYQYGFDVMAATGLPSGTIYAALRRLEKNGYIKGQWEKQAIALKEQRPARRYYELTKAGRVVLAEAVARYHLLGQSSLVTNQPRTTE